MELIKYNLQPGETLDNYKQVLADYNKAYGIRKAHIDKLIQEIQKIREIAVDNWI